MANIPVPYKSQWDQDAKGTRNDCGPASIAMILNYYGETVTTDEVFKRTGAGQGFITIEQMQKAIKSYGYESKYEKEVSPDWSRKLIDQNIPVIALVHYGDLKSRQDTGFTGPHFLVVRGYRDDGYFVNDPNFWDTFRADGDNHFYTKEEFEKAWKNATLDDNPFNSSLLIFPKHKPNTMEISKELYEELVTKATNWDTVADYYKFSADEKKQAKKGEHVVLMIDSRLKELERWIETIRKDSTDALKQKDLLCQKLLSDQKKNLLQDFESERKQWQFEREQLEKKAEATGKTPIKPPKRPETMQEKLLAILDILLS